MVKKPNRRISSHHFLNQTKTFPISDAPECRPHDDPKKPRHRADHHDHDPIRSPRGVHAVDGVRLRDLEPSTRRKRADVHERGCGSAAMLARHACIRPMELLRIVLEPDVLKADMLKKMERTPKTVAICVSRHRVQMILARVTFRRLEYQTSYPTLHDRLWRIVEKSAEECVAMRLLPTLRLSVRPPKRVFELRHAAASSDWVIFL